jgi:hypothetical protein
MVNQAVTGILPIAKTLVMRKHVRDIWVFASENERCNEIALGVTYS